jgi:thiamine biosynthesis lipoprotein
MDTVMSFSVYGPNAQDDLTAIQGEIARIEGLLSVTDENSEVWQLNHTGSAPLAQLSSDFRSVLDTALTIAGETGGALDVTLYPVVKAWGFTTGEYQVPDEATLAALLEGVDYGALDLSGDTLTLPQGVEIDLGAVAKGYAGERCAALLREDGVTSALLNLGGNVQTVGSKPDGSPWRIGIQDPEGDTNDSVAVVELTDRAAVTSGGYQRYFEEDGVRYWHIIDPATGAPARSGLTSVTVVGESGALCDGLSTALFVLGREKALDFWRSHLDWGFDLILLDEDYNIWVTAGLADSFTLLEGCGYTLSLVEE